MSSSPSAKTAILETAARLFQRQGYHATGLNQILQESGAPKGSLYYYFPNGKEQLAVEAIHLTRDTIGEKIRARLSKVDDPAASIHALILVAADSLQNIESIIPCTISLLAMETALVSEPLRAACESTINDWSSAFADKLLQGGYSQEAAQTMGETIQLLIDGALIHSLTKKDTQPLLDIAAHISRLLPARKEEA